MTQTRRWWSRHKMRLALAILAVIAIATPFNILLATVAFSRTGRQAREGAEARARQQLVFPVSCKLYVAAFERGEITLAELRVYEHPKPCPGSPHRP